MFWQYRNDPTGQLMTNAAGQLMRAVGTTIKTNTNTTTNFINIQLSGAGA